MLAKSAVATLHPGGNIDETDICITQRQLERRQLLLANTDASREEEGFGDQGEHRRSLLSCVCEEQPQALALAPR